MQPQGVHPVVAELAETVKGAVVAPGEPAYDEGRAVFNAYVDRHPAAVVRPVGAADVIDVVKAARRHGLAVAAKCGGHSVAGNGTCDADGILLDLSSMKGVTVDPVARRARANAGTLWGEYDRETALFGLATPGGRVTTTGVGGFTLGGGYGWLSPVHGLSCDNLVAADVVTADGRLVHVDETHDADLLWGLRGGSSNFGIVTSFEFLLHPMPPAILAGMMIYPYDRAGEVARQWRDVLEQSPEELVSALAIVLAPPEPFVPPELVGQPVLGVVVAYFGDPAEGEQALQPLRRIAPAVNLVEPMPYTAFQAMLDPFAPFGWRGYNRGEHLDELSDAAIDAYLSAGVQRLSPLSQAVLFRHAGAVARVDDDATAASHRGAAYMVHPIAAWQDPAEDERHIGWVKELSAALAPYTNGGLYLNFEANAGEDLVRRGYSERKYAKLVALKQKWDPDNTFRVNQNIRPAVPTSPPQQRATEAEAREPHPQA